MADRFRRFAYVVPVLFALSGCSMLENALPGPIFKSGGQIDAENIYASRHEDVLCFHIYDYDGVEGIRF